MKKTKRAKKAKETEPIPEKYPCENCGFMTNGDFLCKCGNVLCESHSDEVCNSCKIKEQDRREWKRDMDYLDGDNNESND